MSQHTIQSLERQHGVLSTARAIFPLPTVKNLLGMETSIVEVELSRSQGVFLTSAGRLLDRRGETEVELPIAQTNGGKAVWREGSSKRSLGLANAVFEAFVGSVPAGMSIEHIDGNRLNCAVENLFLVPRRH